MAIPSQQKENLRHLLQRAPGSCRINALNLVNDTAVFLRPAFDELYWAGNRDDLDLGNGYCVACFRMEPAAINEPNLHLGRADFAVLLEHEGCEVSLTLLEPVKPYSPGSACLARTDHVVRFPALVGSTVA